MFFGDLGIPPMQFVRDGFADELWSAVCAYDFVNLLDELWRQSDIEHLHVEWRSSHVAAVQWEFLQFK